MPIVSESSSDPARVFDVRVGTGSTSQKSLPDGRSRTQTGFRSRDLTAKELENLYANSTSGNVVSLIGLLDDLTFDPRVEHEHVNHKDRHWPVHDRDYTETKFRPTGFSWSTRVATYNSSLGKYAETNPRTAQGCLGFTSLNLTTGHLPAAPSDSSASAQAGEMLRNSRPPKAGFDLARFAGEQREAPLLFRMSNYMPRSKKELGGAVLNYLFGIKPTGSDLGKLAETVLASDSGIRQMLSAEKVREKSYRTKVLSSNSGGQTFLLTGSDTTSSGSTLATGWAQLKYYYLVDSVLKANNTLVPVLNTSWTSKQLLRTFATWEYFVPKPAEIHNRLDLYKAKAQELVGLTKVNEDTVYELSPWTWLGDWFLDFGGLLRYQRDVVDNQIVATACGYSVWEEFTGFAHYAGRNVSPNSLAPFRYPYVGVLSDSFTGVQASIQWRRHKRRGGNPYSIAPTWSLNNQQWGILGALGLSRGVDLPNKR